MEEQCGRAGGEGCCCACAVLQLSIPLSIFMTRSELSPQALPDVPLAPLIAGSNSALTARLAALPFDQLLSLASQLHASQQVCPCSTLKTLSVELRLLFVCSPLVVLSASLKLEWFSGRRAEAWAGPWREFRRCWTPAASLACARRHCWPCQRQTGVLDRETALQRLILEHCKLDSGSVMCVCGV